MIIPVAAHVTCFIYTPIYPSRKTGISNARMVPLAFLVLLDK